MNYSLEAVSMVKRARRALANPESINTMSTGQLAALAFVLNKPEYLEQAGLSMAQALGWFCDSEISAIEFSAEHLYDPIIE